MKILLVGPDSLVGKNLISKLELLEENTILKYDITTPYEELILYTEECNYVVFCTTNNKPKFKKRCSNYHYLLFGELLYLLEKAHNSSPIFYYTTAESYLRDNQTQLNTMKALKEHTYKVSSKLIYYPLGNLFGKWDIPTDDFIINKYCYEISHDIDIYSSDTYTNNTLLECYFIDDFIDSIIQQISILESESIHELDNQNMEELHKTETESPSSDNSIIKNIEQKYLISIKDLVSKLQIFQQLRDKNEIPDLSHIFSKKLYITYLSYLTNENLSNSFNNYVSEDRVELFKTLSHGYFYVDTLKPGMSKGNQWHSVKTKKFIVLSGRAIILLRKLNTYKTLSFCLSSNPVKTVDIPVGYTYHISNIGESDLILLIWSSDLIESNDSDTYKTNVQI
jgi:UDP-2-acetamido-2,6-beta-L-arabino-hexul-4-ose reductase